MTEKIYHYLSISTEFLGLGLGQVLSLISSILLLCLQLEKISLRRFRLAPSGLKAGLNGLAWLLIFH